jgi:hypothetical protein
MTNRFIPKWPVRGSSNALMLVCLIHWADDSGMCWASSEQLSSFANCCGETARKCINELIKAGCVTKSRSQRDDDGSFAMNSYQLDLTSPGIAGLFSSLRNRKPSGFPTSSGQTSGNQESCGNQENRCTKPLGPNPESGARGYKDTRASARASSIFLPPSLPDDYFIEDEELRSQVERVLSVCGMGLADIKTPGLLDSLIECLPTALGAGYDFELDILECVKSRTKHFRTDPLWSFRLTFVEDLPKWHQSRVERERRKALRKADQTTSPKSVGKPGARSRKEELDAILANTQFSPGSQSSSAEQEIQRLQNYLRHLEDRNPPDWLLDARDKYLTGPEREQAFKRMRDHYRARLQALGR